MHCTVRVEHTFRLAIAECSKDVPFYFQPSDEDSLSLNVPMSHITEEEGLIKDDSNEHICALTGRNMSIGSLFHLHCAL